MNIEEVDQAVMASMGTAEARVVSSLAEALKQPPNATLLVFIGLLGAITHAICLLAYCVLKAAIILRSKEGE